MDSLPYDIIGEGYEETLKRYLVFAQLIHSLHLVYSMLVLKFLGGVEGGSIQKSMEKETPFFGS